MIRVIAAIPSRFASTRLPGKALINIAGRPLLQWVIEGAKTSKKIDQLLVATDDEKIRDLASSLGVKVKMTSADISNGSDRVWAAVKDEECDVVLNIQGDEPLVDGVLLDRLITEFENDRDLNMATVATDIAPADILLKDTVKVIVNIKKEAIYFSRFPIPYSRTNAAQDSKSGVCLKHMGVYAYRKTFLQRYCDSGVTELEKAESLEQLRALYMGERIKVLYTEHDSWGVDNPEDVIKMEKILSSRAGAN